MPRAGEVDEIWEVLTEEFGQVRTKDERGRRNAAVRQLREAEASPQEIRIAVDFCRRNFTHFTEKAVCSWLSRALHEQGTQNNIRDLFKRIEGGK